MRYLKQFAIILAVSLAGEILNRFIPMPIPASIYGMGIMLFLLMTGILKLDAVKDTARFLIEIMPCMFIPAGVGLITKWAELKSFLIPIAVTVSITTVIVMVCTGRIAQHIIRNDRKKHEKNESEAARNA